MTTDTKPIRLTTRGIRTAEAIRDRVPFTTSGALSGEAVNGWAGPGRLDATEQAALSKDQGFIDYVVYSYATPIAWHTNVKGHSVWHKVNQKFSLTTTKHQGNLYLIGVPA